MEKFDLVVVGAGMLGLAHAWQAARRGLRVAVLERSARAGGASVRNFGMLALVAQAPGPERERAVRTLDLWREIAAEADIPLRQAGALFLARTPEEMDVLDEAAADARLNVAPVARDALERRAGVPVAEGILGGGWSPDAWKLDQREAMARMADWLTRRHGVTFRFGAEVLGVNGGEVETAGGAWRAERVILCGGDEFATLFPEAFARTGVSRCRLQMMRTAPQPAGWRLAPFVLGGLSLTRYAAFAHLPSLAALKAQQAAHQAELIADGIHLIAVQEDDGSVTLGDSHHYGTGPEVRDEDVDRRMLEVLKGLVPLPEPRIAERWMGAYAVLDGRDVLTLEPAEGVTAVTMTNGQGMTHGLGVAGRIVEEVFGAA
ncbi:TIGR03364 family FAD-dependent oxidoreductase [Roseovarius sp. SCSIO 43702]|uniref:TIGR03364 family FAD-dependent oxidoreductase n=1 Tax=Roseovarius sp. SCSIO 43702 TaxID=2823043 RepID=UPI001C736AE2|nr:TIGR03364 family FAD-dependent oxidoreductase [Roseovarius sp. SCSIO 43702]QYX58267.1 TIGR03364 family FAD-dependent oxidoreductase [Roseovarius sp. SCSIO 43702]